MNGNSWKADTPGQVRNDGSLAFGMGAAAGGAPHCACSFAPPARSRKGERSRPRPGLAGASAPAAILASRGKAV